MKYFVLELVNGDPQPLQPCNSFEHAKELLEKIIKNKYNKTVEENDRWLKIDQYNNPCGAYIVKEIIQ